MAEFQGQPGDYRSLAEFFLRPLDPAKRPLRADENFLLSPADGRLSEIEFISTDRATQVKGKTYPLGRFLAAAIDFSQGWHLATIYLSPQQLPSLPLPGLRPHQRLLSRRHPPLPGQRFFLLARPAALREE